MYVIFFGPPGVGKGTQAVVIAGRFGWAHISTGDMFRQHVKERTELGVKVKEIMDQGLLVPDALVIDMFMDRLASLGDGQGFVLDGFPRTLVQAQALDAALGAKGKTIDIAINITAPDNVLLDRMMGRAKESGRSDDTPEAMQTRLQVMKPAPDLLDHYRNAGKLKDVDGTPDVKTVTSAVVEALGLGVTEKK